MKDYLYKFPDEATAQSVLADYYDAENGWKLVGEGFALDPVGVLTDAPSGEWNPPANPTRNQTYTAPDGAVWEWDQPRNPATGQYLSDDPETPESESALRWIQVSGPTVSGVLDGWHLNLRVTDDRPDPASEYAVTPTTQRRVWL